MMFRSSIANTALFFMAFLWAYNCPVNNAFCGANKAIIDDSVFQCDDTVHVEMYCYCDKGHEWKIEWQKEVNVADPRSLCLPETNKDAILIVKNAKWLLCYGLGEKDNDVQVVVPGLHASIKCVDWVEKGIKNMSVELQYYIPKIEKYMTAATGETGSNGTITFAGVSREASYKIIASKAGFYPKTRHFKGGDCEETLVTLCLINRNAVYGSFLYEGAKDLIPRIFEVKLYRFGDNQQTELYKKDYPSQKRDKKERFLFLIEEQYKNDRFVLDARDDIVTKAKVHQDVTVSECPYDIYLRPEYAVTGTVANTEFSFPVWIKVLMSYSYYRDGFKFPIRANLSGRIRWYLTDENGGFLVPLSNKISHKTINQLTDDTEHRSIDGEDAKLYAYIHVTPDTEEGHIYGKRVQLDMKILERLKKGPYIVDVGCIHLEPGKNVSGIVESADHERIEGADVYLMVSGGAVSVIMHSVMPVPLDAMLNNIATHTKTNNAGMFNISSEKCLLPGDYDIFMKHPDYVFTCYPKIEINADVDLGTLVFAKGNRITVNVITGSQPKDIKVVAHLVGEDRILEPEYVSGGILRYSVGGLVPFPNYRISLYYQERLVEERTLKFYIDQSNEVKEVDFIVN